MYLAELHISEFRKLKAATIQFQLGLNVIVGPNNVGKTAIVDSLRALLAGPDEPFLRLTEEDIHAPGDPRPEKLPVTVHSERVREIEGYLYVARPCEINGPLRGTALVVRVP